MIFDIVSPDGYLYMIDKEAKINPNIWYVLGNITGSNYRIEKAPEEYAKTINETKNLLNANKSTCDKVFGAVTLATSNPALWCSGVKRTGESCTKNNNCTYPNCDGLPRLPEVEDDSGIRILAADVLVNLPRDISASDYIKGFIAGYKANPNKYSEEDLRKAFDAGICHYLINNKLLKEVFNEGKSLKEHTQISYDNFLKSLNQPKVPIAVEVEMEPFVDKMGYDDADEPDGYRFKLIDNKVIVKRWIWE